MTTADPEEDDDELLLIRASYALLTDLEVAIPRLLWDRDQSSRELRHHVKPSNLDRVIQLVSCLFGTTGIISNNIKVEPFQGDPQLLDTRLKKYLEPISDALTVSLDIKHTVNIPAGKLSILNALSRLLYVFCKVRGEKVIARFLHNEPKLFIPVLSCLERHSQVEGEDWHIVYALEVWLAHLLLTPFDLSLFDSDGRDTADSAGPDFLLGLPNAAQRVLKTGMQHLCSTSKQQDAAVKLLVRLANRPDMQRLHLGRSLIDWASPQISLKHRSFGPGAGALNLLARLAKSMDARSYHDDLSRIYYNARGMIDQGNAMQTAVDLKLFIKILKSIGKATSEAYKLVDQDARQRASDDLEDVVDRLLTLLGDKDTSVRLAASKAVSLTIVRQPAEYSIQVIEHVMSCLQDGLSAPEDQRQTINAQSTSEFHGLTLTLAFCLSTRSVPSAHLIEALLVLLKALSYERRGPAGQSLAGNVRDAACFGLWSLARRYTTVELCSLPHNLPSENVMGRSIIQRIADHLLTSACLDSEGNVRRGTSAALQELVGRHPNEVAQGISLIQIVDYQAVGLRRRAMIDVTRAASALNIGYWQALTDGLLGWRGIMTVDVPSREAAATSLARLSFDQPLVASSDLIAAVKRLIRSSSAEDRHGALLAAASVMAARSTHLSALHETSRAGYLVLEVTPLLSFQDLLVSRTEWNTYTPGSLRAQHPVGVARFLISLLAILIDSDRGDAMLSETVNLMRNIISGLLMRSEDSVVANIPALTQATLKLRSLTSRSLIDLPLLVSQLRHDAREPGLRGAAYALALGASLPYLGPGDPSRGDTIGVLANLLSAGIIEWRVIGLRSLRQIIHDCSRAQYSPSEEIAQAVRLGEHELMVIGQAVLCGLKDYTITERGDVGSLVRLQAIECVDLLWSRGFADQLATVGQDLTMTHEIRRLSLERLDRTRLAAANCCCIRDTPETEYFKHL